jgi:ATP-dependent RNA helicase HelY
MAVNLVASMGRDAARVLLESSFAQFQADRAVVGLARQVHRHDEAIAGYDEAMHCDLGSAEEYATLRRLLSRREAERARERSSQRRLRADESLRKLRTGDVIRVPAGRRAGLAIVLSEGAAVADTGRLVVLTSDRQVKRLSAVDFPTPVEALAKVRIGRSFNPRSPQSRRDLASSLRDLNLGEQAGDPRRRGGSDDAEAGDEDIARLRRELREHPVHGCPEREQHMRWAERADRLRRESAGLRQRVEGRTNTIARTFDRVCGLLEVTGYLRAHLEGAADAPEVTPEGRRLARLYAESDLLVAECLRQGVWDGLGPPALAAVASSIVYESRTDEHRDPVLPGGPEVRAALDATIALRRELKEVEAAHRLDQLPGLDAGFAWAAFHYAAGAALEKVLSGPGPGSSRGIDQGREIAAGDFVRWTRQLVDLLGQVADVADDPVRSSARRAVEGLRRGVVAVDAQDD